MPAFTLYGARGSTNTDRIRLTLAEGGFTDYELVHVNLQKGEQKVGNLFTTEDVFFLLPTNCASYRASQLLSIDQISIPLLASFDSRTNELTPRF